MKKTISILIVLSTLPMVGFGSTIPRFVITSECITAIEVQEAIYAQGWGLIIDLNESAAAKMLGFSQKYIGKKIRIVDGHERSIIKNDIRVHAYIATPLQVAGLSSQKEAVKAKQSILSTKGICGER